MKKFPIFKPEAAVVEDQLKIFIGGAIAILLGLNGLALFYKPFFQVLAGILPILMLSGGGLAIYLGFDEIKSRKQERE
jgi:hypothetical protein